MAATERVVVLMTAEQKKDVALRAAAEKLTMGEYMLLKALGDDELLDLVIAELAASTKRARAALDRTLAKLNESEKRLPAIEAAARQRAEAESSALDPALFAQLMEQAEVHA